ncbi:MAG: hypothetical protein WBK76_05385 [Candidatus Saccharimonadales bacterium]
MPEIVAQLVAAPVAVGLQPSFELAVRLEDWYPPVIAVVLRR